MKSKLISKHQKGKSIQNDLTESDLDRVQEAVWWTMRQQIPIDEGEKFDLEQFDIQKDTSDVDSFFNSYLQSQGLQRILKNQKQWWNKRHPYKKLYTNWDQGTTNILNMAKEENPHTYTSNHSTTSSLAILQPKFYGPSNHTILIGRNNYENNEYDFNKTFVTGHEYAHGKTPTLFWKPVTFSESSAQGEILQQNQNTKEGHDSEMDEKHADNWGLKYLLYKEGIYDARSDKDITKEQVQKLRKKYPQLRPLQQMNDDQIMFQINHVAENNAPRDLYYAKCGTKLFINNETKSTPKLINKISKK